MPLPATAAPSKVESREIRSANFAQSKIGTTSVLFFGILSFKGTMQHIFDVAITAAAEKAR
jgi:hypothetical protein